MEYSLIHRNKAAAAAKPEKSLLSAEMSESFGAKFAARSSLELKGTYTYLYIFQQAF